MSKAVQKLKKASIDDLKNALTSYLLQSSNSRFMNVTSHMPAYVDEEGSIHPFSTEQKGSKSVILHRCDESHRGVYRQSQCHVEQNLDKYDPFDLEPFRLPALGSHMVALKAQIITLTKLPNMQQRR